MKVCCLSSGSKGNSYYIESNNCKILIDLGISPIVLKERLDCIGVSCDCIDAIFLTHEHSDHILGVASFVKKFPRTKVFAHSCNWASIESKLSGRLPLENRVEFSDNDFLFGDIWVSSFGLCHDSNHCVGFVLRSNNYSIGIMTDTGIVPSNAIEKLMGSDIVIIESNHNEQMLLNNQCYSARLKKRILSTHGHLCNCDCANAIATLYTGGTYQFILAHLSEKNNTPQLAYTEVCKVLEEVGLVEGNHLFIDIALQDSVGHLFEIDN